MTKASKAELIDEHVSEKQCKKAVEALMKHAEQVTKKREENELLGAKEENVWLVLTVKKMQPEKKLKPFKIPVTHPLIDPRTTSICLITKDPQREYKDLLEKHNIKFISRVVGITKLKGKFKPFEARRMLLKENGMFLADERVIPLLPGLLGKKFFDAKKQPIPVSLTKKDLKGELESAVSSSYMHQNQGTCTSIKIGTVSSHSPSQVLDNLKTALPSIVKHIHGGWENVQSFNIKTNSSASLPIWSCDLGEGDEARWSSKKVAEEAPEGLGDVEESDENDKEKQEAKLEKAKGKKRSLDADIETPKKKSKKVSASKEKDALDSEEKPNGSSPVKPEEPSASKKKSKQKEKATESPSAVKSPSKEEQPKKLSTKKSEATKSTESVSPVTPDVPSDSPKLSKKKPSPKTKAKSDDASNPTPTPAAPTLTISKADLKQKRANQSSEKKKDKIVKGKPGKGAKESIVGKAVKARV